jgi:cob(I)alamin adenosyltransferase
MKVYTKTGDMGETSLIGGKRVKKNCLEIDVIGEVDETNALIGVLISELPEDAFRTALERLQTVQHRLFVVGSNIAGVEMKLDKKMPQLTEGDVQELENWVDEMEGELDPLTEFILPGGHEAASHSFLARAVCRRAERRFVDLVEKHPELSPLLKQYINRLSDVLFVLGRWINKKSGHADVVWKK